MIESGVRPDFLPRKATVRKYAAPGSRLYPDYGALVISLDFELYWGVSDLHWPPSPYDVNVLGARVAVPRLLRLFAEHEMAATWAVVGMMFADSPEQAAKYFPVLLPGYSDPGLSSYTRQPDAGRSFYYAPEIIAQIAATQDQEVATHTFSHYYCLEPGQRPQEFEADLAAAVKIGSDHKCAPASIVFPRNQVTQDCLDVLTRHGIVAFRGAQRGWLHEPGPRERQQILPRRTGRLAEAWFASANFSYAWQEIPRPDGLSDVRASRYLRCARTGPQVFRKRHVDNVVSGIHDAARAKRVFHLWWHPEDMGQAVDEQMECVKAICEAFAFCRHKYGMRSMSMVQAAEAAAGGPARADSAASCEPAEHVHP